MTTASAPAFLAFDLGATSGRAVLGRFDDDRLSLEEVHRFPNGPVCVGDSLFWDILRLWDEMQRGLALAAARAGDSLVSIGVDTWGVDFGLLAEDDTLLGNPYCYRDARTDGMLEAAFEAVPRDEIYAQTGIQFMQLNSLYQLLALARANAADLRIARRFLNVPDLLNFWLSGVKASEFTIVSTTQCYNPVTENWAWPLLERLGIPTAPFGEIVPPGTTVGALRPSVMRDTGAPSVKVIATASHDTAAAVAAVPAEVADYAYISSGTWSLMGVEVSAPVISAASLAANLTNEGGVNGTIRLLKNIMGMWLIEECRRTWAQAGHSYSYGELTALAENARPFSALIWPGDPRFLAPGDMPARIAAACVESGGTAPAGPGELVRCVLESLALEYRRVLELIESVQGRSVSVVHVVGGGSRNALLNQFTANATARPVVAGPVEATATGNILVQAVATGHVASIAEGRALLRRFAETSTFAPADVEQWEAAYQRYGRLVTALEEAHTG
ncbi:MAG: FGGY-family carbohydrate kinase [Anaerolineae bacterium]